MGRSKPVVRYNFSSLRFYPSAAPSLTISRCSKDPFDQPRQDPQDACAGGRACVIIIIIVVVVVIIITTTTIIMIIMIVMLPRPRWRLAAVAGCPAVAGGGLGLGLMTNNQSIM